MFDAITICSSFADNRQIDLGLIAERLIYYGTVHIILGPGGIAQLVGQVGLDTFCELIEDHNLRVKIVTGLYVAVPVQQDAPFPSYDFAIMNLSDGRGNLISVEEELRKQIERVTGRRGHSLHAAKRIMTYAKEFDIVEDVGIKGGVPELARNLLDRPTVVKELVQKQLESFVDRSRVPHNFRFDVVRHSSGFHVDSDLDFNILTQMHRATHPQSGMEISPERLLMPLMSVAHDIFFSSLHKSDLSTRPQIDALVAHVMEDVVRKSTTSFGNIEIFQEIIFDNAQAIREVVNNSARDIRDIMALRCQQRYRDFRSWMSDIDDTREPSTRTRLVREYLEGINTFSRITSLPEKKLRYTAFTLMPAVIDMIFGTPLGLLSATVDAFLIDKLKRGWRPGQFVEESLRPFAIARSRQSG